MATTLTRVTTRAFWSISTVGGCSPIPGSTRNPATTGVSKLAFSPTTLPPLAAVVASHDHYDHYDVAGFANYPDKLVPFIVKRGMAAKARQAGFANVTELEPWDEVSVGPLRITAAPARHGVPEITFILRDEATTVSFGADTLRNPELDEVGQRFPVLDAALLPVDGLTIRPAFNRQVVMTAEQAAELCGVLQPRVAVPIHYAVTAGPVRDRLILKYNGTPERFERAAAQHAPETTVRILTPGDPLNLITP
jgi:L-ascorbate metabolism protein UlaG (beta-lactamase superfamily)